MLLKGNCLETLKTLDTASVDSIVTDPPYELGFMGKSWDNSGIAYSTELWAECLRVLKPGGHLLAFSGSRTYHRMVVAIEDSGFEIRDQIAWISNKTFPKSLNVSKAIDKAAGAEREKIRTSITTKSTAGKGTSNELDERPWLTEARKNGYHEHDGNTPATPEAQQWQGWGTALKPSMEPICMARKPLIGTVANNVLIYGTGALNIDGSRVGTADGFGGGAKGTSGFAAGYEGDGFMASTLGRWPANVIHDGSDEVLAGFPTTAPSKVSMRGVGYTDSSIYGSGDGEFDTLRGFNDSGSAARFFYCAKASKSERNAGMDSNTHPTVKPLALMRYLIKLVTPPNGIVLDPFLGSGTTAVAATLEGFEWIGCEMTEDYWPIIEARVEWAQTETGKTLF